MKYYIQDDESKHEIRADGYVVDAVTDDGIIHEIQSKAFFRLRDKLTKLSSNHTVEVVLPITTSKEIVWISPVSNEIVSVNKSSTHNKIQKLLVEMYGLRELLDNDKLIFRAILIEEREYKYLDGYGPNYKNKATKINKIPTKLIRDQRFTCRDDFREMVPFSCDTKFTSREFAKATKISLDDARTSLLVLTELGIVSRIGKVGNNILYKLGGDIQ